MKKKMLAPVIISVIVILYYGFYFGLMISLLEGWWKYLLGIIPVIIAGAMIYVCRERIKEITEGEEDDLGKY